MTQEEMTMHYLKEKLCDECGKPTLYSFICAECWLKHEEPQP